MYKCPTSRNSFEFHTTHAFFVTRPLQRDRLDSYANKWAYVQLTLLNVAVGLCDTGLGLGDCKLRISHSLSTKVDCEAQLNPLNEVTHGVPVSIARFIFGNQMPWANLMGIHNHQRINNERSEEIAYGDKNCWIYIILTIQQNKIITSQRDGQLGFRFRLTFIW